MNNNPNNHTAAKKRRGARYSAAIKYAETARKTGLPKRDALVGLINMHHLSAHDARAIYGMACKQHKKHE